MGKKAFRQMTYRLIKSQIKEFNLYCDYGPWLEQKLFKWLVKRGDRRSHQYQVTPAMAHATRKMLEKVSLDDSILSHFGQEKKGDTVVFRRAKDFTPEEQKEGPCPPEPEEVAVSIGEDDKVEDMPSFQKCPLCGDVRRDMIDIFLDHGNVKICAECLRAIEEQ